MFKCTLIVMLAALFGNGIAFAQENRGTPEQRAACASDAFRLCASYIPRRRECGGVSQAKRVRPERCLQSRLRPRCGNCFGQGHRIAPVPRRKR
jgi:hypothetical protein